MSINWLKINLTQNKIYYGSWLRVVENNIQNDVSNDVRNMKFQKLQFDSKKIKNEFKTARDYDKRTIHFSYQTFIIQYIIAQHFSRHFCGISTYYKMCYCCFWKMLRQRTLIISLTYNIRLMHQTSLWFNDYNKLTHCYAHNFIIINNLLCNFPS